MQALKLHIGNIRMKKKLKKLIKMYKEWSYVKYQGLEDNIIKAKDKPIRMVENISRILKERELIIENRYKIKQKLAENKTIIKYVKEYVLINKSELQIIKIINKVRRFKRIILLCEIFRQDSRSKTQYGTILDERSLID